jgi:hypothetical protein
MSLSKMFAVSAHKVIGLVRKQGKAQELDGTDQTEMLITRCLATACETSKYSGTVFRKKHWTGIQGKMAERLRRVTQA